ncbi:MAG: hemerythrin domain-containing protein [Pirellulales bacterium]|nr:hemerythrin domain-containing protein [Pirellulales bacterium]
MNTTNHNRNTQGVNEVFAVWNRENQALEAEIGRIRAWMSEVNQFGIPRFGEAATLLNQLRSHLVNHFDCESRLCAQLSGFWDGPCPELDQMCRQATHDHAQILLKLDDLIERLQQIDPPFASWQAAMNEVDLFVEYLEQHEEQESESLQALAPLRDHADTKSANRPR